MCMLVPVSMDTVCRLMFSQNWCQVPSWQQQWWLWQPMKNCILGPQVYQSACTAWAPYHRNTHKSHDWTGCSCQASATGSPPDQDYQRDINKASKGWVLGTVDLQGLTEWLEAELKQARELLLKWEHLFVHSDLDLGKTALIKHKIQLTDQTPFKECYQCIPPHMYDDLGTHIQEMLDKGAMHKLHSLWASAVVLVQKKDGGLRFCIDLRNLNNWTVKDQYLLPYINETLGSL